MRTAKRRERKKKEREKKRRTADYTFQHRLLRKARRPTLANRRGDRGTALLCEAVPHFWRTNWVAGR